MCKKDSKSYIIRSLKRQNLLHIKRRKMFSDKAYHKTVVSFTD